MFEAVISDGPEKFVMRIDIQEGSIFVALNIGKSPISSAGLAALQASVKKFFSCEGDILHRISASEEHWYAVDFNMLFTTENALAVEA